MGAVPSKALPTPRGESIKMKRSALKADPAKTAAFVARGRAKGLRRTNRAPMARKPLSRAKALRTARPKPVGVPFAEAANEMATSIRAQNKALRRKQRAGVPPEVRAAVLQRDDGLCVWSRHLGQHVRATQLHHLLPRQGWPEYIATPENLCSMAPLPHMQHEFSPSDRLPWAALPDECREFLRRVAVVDARAARLIRIRYPGAQLIDERGPDV